MKIPKSETLLGLLCIAGGLALALTIAASGPLPTQNAIFYWAPQLLVFLALLPLRPRGAVFAGVALMLALYCAAFVAWMFSRQHPDPAYWLGYPLTFPGAIIAALLIASWSARNPATQTARVFGATLLVVLLGIAANQLLVCSTLLYCVAT